jgi:PAS domain S-box-containing protein
MITLYDPEVNVLLLNREFQQLTGWTSTAAAEVDLMAEIYPDPDYRAEVAAFMDSRSGWMDIRMRTRDGAELETMWANVALSDDRRVGIGLDISKRKRAERHRQLLIAELDHRVKNTLAVVQSIARQSFRGVPSAAAATTAFLGRLQALAAAHDLLTQTGRESADLRELATASATTATARVAAVRLAGPDVLLSPKQAVALGMAFHELATNASRHGALSVEAGRVDVSWRVEAAPGGAPRLLLEWRETGGPLVTTWAAKGFGARLLEQLLPRDLRGTAELTRETDGIRWRLDAPLAPPNGASPS